METILTKDKKQETQEVMELLFALNEKEREDFINYMKAIKFVKKHGNEFGLA